VGTWTVYDLVGTKSIGSTEVTFKPQGELSVKPPMQVSSRDCMCAPLNLIRNFSPLGNALKRCRDCDGGSIPDQLIWIRARSRC
jgi:hypothetical protein